MATRELIGMTFHFSDKSVEKVPLSALVEWRKGSTSKGSGKRYNWIDEPECPEHGRWDVVPAGSNDQKSWGAFYSCTDRECLNRPGRDWVANNDPDDYAAESANDDSMDDLPF